MKTHTLGACPSELLSDTMWVNLYTKLRKTDGGLRLIYGRAIPLMVMRSTNRGRNDILRSLINEDPRGAAVLEIAESSATDDDIAAFMCRVHEAE